LAEGLLEGFKDCEPRLTGAALHFKRTLRSDADSLVDIESGTKTVSWRAPAWVRDHTAASL